MATARRKLSNNGLNFIARQEGFRSQPYNDAAGHATIGIGHLLHYGPVTKKEYAYYKKHPLSFQAAIALMRKDAAKYEDAVNRLVKVPLAQAQFDALVSLAFNIGSEGLRQSAVLRELNAEHRTRAADAFLMWNKALNPRTKKIEPLEGLTRRRKEERRMFLTGITQKPKPKEKVGRFLKGPSAHFTWLEVHRGRKPWTMRTRLNAIKHARNLEKLRTAVNKERARHGLKPTSLNILSWYRPEWYNTKIGGARASQHIHALGTDISLQEIDRLFPWKGGRERFDRICNSIFANQGFGQYPGGSRHVDTRGYKARWTSWGR